MTFQAHRKLTTSLRAGLAAALALALSLSGLAVPASAAPATHEITASWGGTPTPTVAPFGQTITGEWRINTNDSADPYSNEIVPNVNATLTVGSGVFTSIPVMCKTIGVTPVSSISADGMTLLCNVGEVKAGTASIIQAPIRTSGQSGGNLTASGTVESPGVAASAPASPPPLPITYIRGMDLSLVSAPGTNYQGGIRASRTGGNRTFIQMNFSLILTAGSRPGPASYSFPVAVTGSLAGSMTGFQWEGCVPVTTNSASTGQPFSDPAQADKTNFPTCTVTGSGANYTVATSGLTYSLVNTPTRDSLSAPLPGMNAYIASATVLFSIPTPVTLTTTYTFNASAAGPFLFNDSVSAPDIAGNNISSATLTPAGGFSNTWRGTPTDSRSVWDANLWVSPGTALNMPLPIPGINTMADLNAKIAADGPASVPVPLHQMSIVTYYQDYQGPGAAQMAGTCTMNQNPNFVYTSMDGGGSSVGGGYRHYTTARYFYTTAAINTKTETCGQAAPSAMWIEAFPAPGSVITDPRITTNSLVTLPAGVTAVKMTWNPAVDRPGATGPSAFTFLRAYGHISPTAPTSGEAWSVGTFTFPGPGAPQGPGFPTLNNWHNISTRAGGINLPGSTYGPNMNIIRDALRFQGPQGQVTKSASDTTAQPGVPVTYTIGAQAINAITTPPPVSFPVIDTLPVGMQYVAGSATPAPTSVSADLRTLTWNFTNVPANVSQTITYQAQIPANTAVAPGTSLTNTVVINVPGDNRLANTPGRSAQETVVVPSSASTSLGKASEDNVLSFYGDTSAWNLVVNSQDPVSNSFTDTIDILPRVGDGRGTNIDGTYSITGVTAPAGSTVYYSVAPFANLSTDPRVASNGGTPGSIAGNTVGWTTTFSANPTAIRVIAPALAPGASQNIRIAFSTPSGTDCAIPALADNKPGQLLVNSAGSFAGNTRLPMLSSASMVIGDCYALDLKKYVLEKGGDPSDPADFHDANAVADYQVYALGDTVPFRIIVTNKGTGTLTNIAVSDPIAPGCAAIVVSLAAGASQRINCSMTATAVGATVNTASASVSPPAGPPLTPFDPAGFVVPEPYTVAKTSNPASGTPVLPGSVVQYTVTVREPATSAAPWPNPSFSDDLSDVLDDASFNAGSIVVTAGGGTASITGTTLTWSSLQIMPGQEITITYSVTVGAAVPGNGTLRNVVTPPSGISCAQSCGTSHPIPALRFTKVADTAVAQPGDTVIYTVTAQNTGAVAYTALYPASFSDDLTDVLADASFVPGSATGGAVYTAPSIAWSGSLAVGGTAVFTYSVTVNAAGGDDTLDNRVVSTTPGNNCAVGSTDPACDARVLVQSYTVEKSTAEAPVVRGDVVVYTLRVTNTGVVPYSGGVGDSASFADVLTDVLDDASYNNNVTGGATFDAATETLSWSGSLAVGQIRIFTYSVTVSDPATGDLRLSNTVSPTGPGGSCLSVGACDTVTPIAQFTVAKTADVASTVVGGTVRYTVTVTNTGGVDFTALYPASFVDSFAGIVDDGDLVPGSIVVTPPLSGTATYIAPSLSWSGAIPIGGVVTVEYDVLVDAPVTGNDRLVNRVTTPPGLANCDTASSDPDCSTNTPIQSYRVVKTADQDTVEVGDDITYTFTVTNTGQVAYPSTPGGVQASIVDPLTDVLANSAPFDASTLTASSGTASFDVGTQSVLWAGDLPVGGPPVTITFTVTIITAIDDDNRLINRVETTGPGGNCADTSNDPVCELELPRRAYEVEKSADKSVVEPGATVEYTISIRNTGVVAYDADFPAIVTDDLADVLADSAIVPGSLTFPAGWTGSVVGTQLTASGPLAVGGPVRFIRYSVQIDSPYPDTGDHRLENRASTPPGQGGNCTSDATDPDCDAVVLVREFTVEKTVNTKIAEIRDTVTYTILVTNTGQVAYDGLTPATSAKFEDDFSGVLDDATYLNDATGTTTYAAPTLTWEGALAIGETVKVTYSFRVNAEGGDNRTLNVVRTTFDTGGSCVVSTDPGCSTLTMIERRLPVTGVTGMPTLVGLAGLLLGVGGLLLLLYRRKRTRVRFWTVQ